MRERRHLRLPRTWTLTFRQTVGVMVGPTKVVPTMSLYEAHRRRSRRDGLVGASDVTSSSPPNNSRYSPRDHPRGLFYSKDLFHAT